MDEQKEWKVEPERVEKLLDLYHEYGDNNIWGAVPSLCRKSIEIIPPLYESWKEYERKIAEQKAEIERLTEANEQLYCNCLNENTERLGDMRKIECLEDKNSELQKQVDELKEDRNKQRKLYVKEFAEHANHLGDFEKIKQQAVKDTAKEILQIIKEEYGYIGNLEKIIKERYGIEVDN